MESKDDYAEGDRNCCPVLVQALKGEQRGWGGGKIGIFFFIIFFFFFFLKIVLVFGETVEGERSNEQNGEQSRGWRQFAIRSDFPPLAQWPCSAANGNKSGYLATWSVVISCARALCDQHKKYCNCYTDHRLLYRSSKSTFFICQAANKKCCRFVRLVVLVNLLIIKDNIWSPNVVGRHMQLFHSSILVRVPNQFVVIPKLKEQREKRIRFVIMTAFSIIAQAS